MKAFLCIVPDLDCYGARQSNKPVTAMKENILYWIRVLILTGVLLFILVSCTAWAGPIQAATDAQSFMQEAKQALHEQAEAQVRTSTADLFRSDF